MPSLAIPLGVRGLVKTQMVLPLHMRESGETPVTHVYIRRTKRKIRRNRDGNALTVAKRQTAWRTAKVVRGDGAVQKKNHITLTSAEEFKGAVGDGFDLAHLLKGQRLTLSHDAARIRPAPLAARPCPGPRRWLRAIEIGTVLAVEPSVSRYRSPSVDISKTVG